MKNGELKIEKWRINLSIFPYFHISILSLGIKYGSRKFQNYLRWYLADICSREDNPSTEAY